MIPSWIIEKIRERETERPTVELELPLPIREPEPEAAPPDSPRGVVVIDL